jgi:hypothetical protein
MTYKEAIEVLKKPVDNINISMFSGTPEVVLTSAHVRAIELALEALGKMQSIAPVGNVYPDWYKRLSDLNYDYDPVKDGNPWYRAEDVWACIESIPEEHREFGGKDGNT